jgi:hypothetical protein
VDALRLPSPLDPSAGAYKDWLHLNLFDPATGAVGIVNVSIHGSPDDARSRAVGTALVHLPDGRWLGNVETMALAAARLLPAGVGMERVALAIDREGVVHVAASFPEDGLTLRARAIPETRPLAVERQLPFGPGWIAWRAVPRLRVEGEWRLDVRGRSMDGCSAYHDHNWGRWHWGDDVGWEWAACLGTDTTIVVSRTADRARLAPGPPMLVVETGRVRRTFRGASITLVADGALPARPRRLPGALAAARQDRARPRLPARVTVIADDGIDRCELRIRPRHAAQLIAADPVRPGYGFVHELSGEFAAVGRIAGTEFETDGLAVFEHVD